MTVIYTEMPCSLFPVDTIYGPVPLLSSYFQRHWAWRLLPSYHTAAPPRKMRGIRLVINTANESQPYKDPETKATLLLQTYRWSRRAYYVT